ncbi:MAG TPA: hypothetical protein VFK80_09280 [Limnochordia bacterium]|nr:hypothetical protein [Limnochordia bacterium]
MQATVAAPTRRLGAIFVLLVLALAAFGTSALTRALGPIIWPLPTGALALDPQDPTIDLFGHAAGFDTWLHADVRYLEGVRHGGLDAAERTGLQAQEAALTRAVDRLEQHGAIVDPTLGYRLYTPAVSGRLFALTSALTARQTLLRDGAAWQPAPYAFQGYTATLAEPSHYPKVAQIRAALAELRLPAALFHGYRVYALPYTLTIASGLGGSGYALIGSDPPGDRWLADQTYITTQHEFGHELEFRFLGHSPLDHPLRWFDYLSERGVMWHFDSRPDETAWAYSPEESFAEDVRVLFGGHQASAPYQGAYTDPLTDPQLAARLSAFISNLVQHPAEPAGAGPWQVRAETARTIIAGGSGALRLMAALLAGLALVWSAGSLVATWRTRDGRFAPRSVDSKSTYS